MTAARRVVLWGPVVLYMAAIFAVSAESSPPVPGGISDKVLHAGAFFVLAGLVVRALGGGLPPLVNGTTAWQALLICVAYAVTDEMHQMFVPFRSAEIADLLADMTGAAAGVGVCWAWHIISGSDATSPTSTPER